MKDYMLKRIKMETKAIQLSKLSKNRFFFNDTMVEGYFA